MHITLKDKCDYQFLIFLSAPWTVIQVFSCFTLLTTLDLFSFNFFFLQLWPTNLIRSTRIWNTLQRYCVSYKLRTTMNCRFQITHFLHNIRWGLDNTNMNKPPSEARFLTYPLYKPHFLVLCCSLLIRKRWAMLMFLLSSSKIP